MKEWFVKVKTALGSILTLQNILIFIVVLAMLVSGWLIYRSWNAPSAQALAILQTQNAILQETLDSTIMASNARIKTLEAKFKVSQVNVATLTKKLKGMEVQYGKIEIPKGKPETVKRFNALGYHPR